MTSIEYLYVPSETYGKERRAFIKQWFEQHPEGRYCVNAKYRPQMKHDTDLQELVKAGFLKVIRCHQSSTHAKTFVVRA